MDAYLVSPYIHIERIFRSHVVIVNNAANTVLRIDKSLALTLFHLRHTRLTQESLQKTFELETITQLIGDKLLLPIHSVWKQHAVTTLEIETCSQCNWHCAYCPVGCNQRKKTLMSEALFNRLLEEGFQYPSIRYITLHGFNEPTLDRRITAFISKVFEKDFKLRLYTNGSHFTEELFHCLAANKHQTEITFNFPSANEISFAALTGSRDYKKSRDTILRCLHLKIPTSINVQGHRHHVALEKEHLRKMFVGANIIGTSSMDRAGLLTNEYCDHYYNDTPLLHGCNIPMKSLFIDVGGLAYLCCNDFHRHYILGDSNNQSFREILESDNAVKFRKSIWGGMIMDKDFICRRCVHIQHLNHNAPHKVAAELGKLCSLE